jgi:ABC-type Fe3+ transport system substrate-binding protein
VTLGPIHETAGYTVTVLNRAPDTAGAVAFVRFLLGPQGQRLLRKVGVTLLSPPTAVGTGIPGGLSQVIEASS